MESSPHAVSLVFSVLFFKSIVICLFYTLNRWKMLSGFLVQLEEEVHKAVHLRAETEFGPFEGGQTSERIFIKYSLKGRKTWNLIESFHIFLSFVKLTINFLKIGWISSSPSHFNKGFF